MFNTRNQFLYATKCDRFAWCGSLLWLYKKKLIISVLKLIEVDLSMEDTSVSHRLSGKSDSNPQPNIIARFCPRRIRNEIYSHRHRLKEYNKTHPQECININESLTRSNCQSFNKCLLYRKSNNFKHIWTRNGTTYLRQNENSNTIAITKESDFVRCKIINHQIVPAIISI